MYVQLFYIAFWLVVSSCSFNRVRIKEPVRVKGIPEKAFWVGGPDGGNWYLAEDAHDRNNVSLKVYNDQDGGLIISKRFILVCPVDNQMPVDDLRSQIDGFDGKRIFLRSRNGKKYCYLE